MLENSRKVMCLLLKHFFPLKKLFEAINNNLSVFHRFTDKDYYEHIQTFYNLCWQNHISGLLTDYS